MNDYKKQMIRWASWCFKNKEPFSMRHIDDFFSECGERRVLDNKRIWFSLAMEEYNYVKQLNKKNKYNLQVGAYFPLDQFFNPIELQKEGLNYSHINTSTPPLIILAMDNLLDYYNNLQHLSGFLFANDEQLYFTEYRSVDNELVRGLLLSNPR